MSVQRAIPNGTMDANIEPLVAMRQSLIWIPDRVIEYESEVEAKYFPESMGYQDARLFDDKAIETLIGQVKLALMSAADHMHAISRALDGPVLFISPWTISRTVLEASALVYWLLDPKESPQNRIAKSLVRRILDVYGQAKFANAQGPLPSTSESELENFHSRVEEIVLRASSLKIGVDRKESGRVLKIGSIPLNVTSVSIANEFLESEKEYRMLSGFVHQNSTPLLELGMREIPGNRQRVFSPSMNFESYKYFITSLLKWYGAASYRYFEYCGFDSSWLKTEIDTALKVVLFSKMHAEEEAKRHL